MLMTSVYEIDCLCGSKFQTANLNGKCAECSRPFSIESWQVRHTLTADGKVIRTENLKQPVVRTHASRPAVQSR
jgi:hypothetical protein